MKWTHHSPDTFPRWAPGWDTLNRAGGNLPFLESRAIACALRGFDARRVRLVVGHVRGELAAMGLLAPSGPCKWDSWQPSQLPLAPFVLRPPHTLASALPDLLAALPGLALSAGITQLDPAIYPRPDPALTLRPQDYLPTAVVRVAGPFEDYWAARGKNLRHNVKRQLAKLSAQNVSVALDCLTAPGEVADAIVQYSQLESSSWKAALGTAVLADNAQGRFYRDVLESFARTGDARIYRYRFDDTVVAMDLCVQSGDVLVILKTAFDDRLQGLSPGVLMHSAVFEHLFGEGAIKRVEFFGRVMEWHTRWTDEVRMLYHVTAYRHAALPRLSRFVRLFGRGTQADLASSAS